MWWSFNRSFKKMNKLAYYQGYMEKEAQTGYLPPRPGEMEKLKVEGDAYRKSNPLNPAIQAKVRQFLTPEQRSKYLTAPQPNARRILPKSMGGFQQRTKQRMMNLMNKGMFAGGAQNEQDNRTAFKNSLMTGQMKE